MSQYSSYHAGELAVQERAGESRMARVNGGALSDRIPAGAIPFLAQQPMVVAASTAADGSVWASLLVGEPGFVRADDALTLNVDLSRPRSASDDPLWSNLERDHDVGLLLIELSTRRRLRVNGRAVFEADGRQLRIEVGAAYPNCPKYIQRRAWSRSPMDPGRSDSCQGREGVVLDDRQRQWMTSADTLFVASAAEKQGADASHRGGRPGFVRMIAPQTLRVPDYGGNSMFNTLGNFQVNPHAGLAFIDFESGWLLQITGRVAIRWDLDDPQALSGGTGRFWDLEVMRWRESALPLRLTWEFVDYSPFNPGPAATSGHLPLQVVEVRQVDARIKRFRLRAFDDAALPGFSAGAHLPVSLPIGSQASEWRHYSILSDPLERSYYDIAVSNASGSRGGSRYMHESLRAGDQISAAVPRNDFPLDPTARHSILIAGGIGITPILGMLRHLAAAGDSYELHYSAKRASGLAFRSEIERIAGNRAFFYATREEGDTRMPLDDLLGVCAADTHVYVCGPRTLIDGVRDTARANGWRDAQIHFESFGVAPLRNDRAIAVELVRSGTSVIVPAELSILDSLLDAGIEVPHGCKRGECGLCITTVLHGEPDHRDFCLAPDERKQALCVCVSRATSERLVLDR